VPQAYAVLWLVRALNFRGYTSSSPLVLAWRGRITVRHCGWNKFCSSLDMNPLQQVSGSSIQAPPTTLHTCMSTTPATLTRALQVLHL
jgi:hypothetical protein